uniref:NADH dehydrogenase subunit 4L n=1 Tax=Euplotes cristatus TaxID=756077 RepID=UPI002E76BF2F|nr:NADH dehydrogenase subunit 4L [Euplotes cristatus]UPM52060.1 NADH dehydrogenase subunit 4L [Euplotes cristatus]
MLFATSSFDLVCFCFIVLFYCGLLFMFKSSSLLFLLIIMETTWISLYLTSLVSAFVLDYLMCLSLGFFFLMFSAAEISTGLALFLFLLRGTPSLTFNYTRAPVTDSPLA